MSEMNSNRTIKNLQSIIRPGKDRSRSEQHQKLVISVVTTTWHTSVVESQTTICFLNFRSADRVSFTIGQYCKSHQEVKFLKLEDY